MSPKHSQMRIILELGLKLFWIFGSNQELFIQLKKIQSVNIRSVLAFFIWSFEVQITTKRRIKSQIDSLIPDH
jgi:hypothetical protein